VRGVNFAVTAGETFGFPGPNGAGKSTTIKILCTLVNPTHGSAKVAGYDVVKQRDDVRETSAWSSRTPPSTAISPASRTLKRRLEIARGLLHAPRVLFLDEPTVGLDPATRTSIREYVNDLKRREDITIFLTAHYMDEAEHCDRIAIVDHGGWWR